MLLYRLWMLILRGVRILQISHVGKAAKTYTDTHQLSPRSYFLYSRAKTRIFIDHDDKIAETKLSTAFEWTSKTYQKMFNSVYSECTCWYCESVRESHTSSISQIFKSSNNPVSQELDRLYESSGSYCNPEKAPHLSVHGTVKDPNAIQAVVKRQEMERNYQKACRRAQKKGREPPSRDLTYSYWGYPMIMPFYAPYMGVPLVGGLYPGNPGCASFEPGAAGNCCQGENPSSYHKIVIHC
jgi:hypothetical protein